MLTRCLPSPSLLWAAVLAVASGGCAPTVVVGGDERTGAGAAGSGPHAGGEGGSGGTGGEPGPPCAEVTVPSGPASSCDGTGDCGGVSQGGCILCAIGTVCAEAYDAFIAAQQSPGIDGWTSCHNECWQAEHIGCCFQQCNTQYPDVAAGHAALVSCVDCGACRQDCAAEDGPWFYGLACEP